MIGLAIALKYAFVRRQFSKTGDMFAKEQHLIDYQLHQQRLIPRFAKSLVMKFAIEEIQEMWLKNSHDIINAKGEDLELFHAMSAFHKAKMSADAQDDILEAR